MEKVNVEISMELFDTPSKNGLLFTKGSLELFKEKILIGVPVTLYDEVDDYKYATGNTVRYAELEIQSVIGNTTVYDETTMLISCLVNSDVASKLTGNINVVPRTFMVAVHEDNITKFEIKDIISIDIIQMG
jgi:hypothetical protein